MRTDLRSRIARRRLRLALAGMLALALPLPAVAQADTAGAGRPRAAPVAPEPPAAPEAPLAPAAVESGDRVQVFGGNRTIAEGESVRDVLVVGGNLRVRGEVRGDAVVVGGNLTLYETGRIRGDVVVAGGRFRNEGGTVEGEMRTMDRLPGAAATALPREAREAREAPRREGMFSRIGRGFAGIVSTLALSLVLGAIGALLVFFAHRHLETVSDTLRASTLRSGAVGLAAAFLVVPAFVVLIVALAVSIVGIPLLLVAIPLYPLAVAAAAIYGLLAAAYALGERTSEQRPLYEASRRNAYAYLATGLVILFAPVVAGYLLGMTPFLGWVGGLVRFLAYVGIWVATTAGLGAVILSRGGTRRTFARRFPPEMDEPVLDDDPFVGAPRG